MQTVISGWIVVQNATGHCAEIVRIVNNIAFVEISIIFEIEFNVTAVVDE